MRICELEEGRVIVMNQCDIICNDLRRNLMPPIPEMFDLYTSGKHALYRGDDLSNEQIEGLIACGSYWGNLIRIKYNHYINVREFERWTFWNALIFTFLWGQLWIDSDLIKEFLKSKQAKDVLQYISNPEWVSIGLCGASWGKIIEMCEKCY